MSFDHYRSLIDQVCELTLIPNPETLYENASLQVRGVDFSLFYRESPGAGEVLIYCGFGPLPQRRRDEVMQCLLETNLYLFNGQNSPALAYNAETGQVVLVSVLLLDALEAQRLLDMLGYISGMAKQWQESYFLKEPQKTEHPMPHGALRSSLAKAPVR